MNPMTTREKALALARIMGWQVIDYGETVQEFSGDFISLHGKVSCSLQPYAVTEEGLAQFGAIVLAHARDIVIEVANDISLHRYEEPTREHILDTVLRMEGLL